MGIEGQLDQVRRGRLADGGAARWSASLSSVCEGLACGRLECSVGEIYAVSVALSEFLHLSYVSDEMGWSIDLPLEIQVDNAAAIAFSGGNTRRSKLRHIDVRQQWAAQLPGPAGNNGGEVPVPNTVSVPTTANACFGIHARFGNRHSAIVYTIVTVACQTEHSMASA